MRTPRLVSSGYICRWQDEWTSLDLSLRSLMYAAGHGRLTEEPMTILVVDDQPDAGLLLCRLLGRCGYQCHYSPSADEALEFLNTSRPTLAILDVMMPETDGLTLLEQIRANRGLAG